MDVITCLPKTARGTDTRGTDARGTDALMTFVDKLTKMVQKLTKQAAEAYRDSPYEAVSWTRKQDYP